MKPKIWWKNNADVWFKKIKYWNTQSKGNSKNFLREENFLVDEISKNGFKKILEIGAGDGRIIGRLSHWIPDCSSIDINIELSKYVAEKYPLIKTYIGEIINLPFKDKAFDLVYTHEVLQHIEPAEIEKACSELKRVGKEVWTLENWRDKEPNEKVSDSHGGRWNWDLKKYFNPYYEFYTDWGQLFLKSGTDV